MPPNSQLFTRNLQPLFAILNPASRILKPAAASLAALTLLVIAAAAVFLNLGVWLVVADPVPERLDAIFTFGGENARIAYAETLRQRYPRAVWIISNKGKAAYLARFGRQGLDTSRILFVDTCTNTRTEVEFLKAWIAGTTAGSPAGGAMTVGLVSGPYHMRRISILVKRMMPRSGGCTIAFLPVPYSYYGATRADYRFWWRKPGMRRVVEEEWLKTLGEIAGVGKRLYEAHGR
jgi:uncharacterized SAM-binding protein YcdF (DUF218 family)